MAAEQIKITGYLTCPACYELYKMPKYLPCYHSYCEECLVKLVVQSNIACPECKKTSLVPSGGVKQLPNNFLINRLIDEIALKCKVEREEETECDLCVRRDPGEVLCLDCGTFLCNHCVDNHRYSKDWQDHNLMPLKNLTTGEYLAIKPKAKDAMCLKHDLGLNFYCETCDQLVCYCCIMNDHLKHDHDTVKEMAAKHRKELDTIMEPAEKMIEGLSVTCKKVSNTRNEIGLAQADDIDREIDRYYEELHQRLQQQRDELKKELRELCIQKKKEVELQIEETKYTQAQLEIIKELNIAMRNGSDQEALLMKKKVVDDMKRISDSYNKLVTQPVLSPTIEFIIAEEHKNSMPQFGHLLIMNYEVLGIPEMISKGKKCTFKIVAKDQNSHVFYKEGSKVVIYAQSNSGDVTPVEVNDNKDGNYSASFVPNQVGEVKLSVAVMGQQIEGSPFIVKVYEKYTTIDKPRKAINEGGQLGNPWGIAFGSDGMWAVTDDSNHCVWIFDREDQLVKKFGSYGAGNGNFNRPLGVAFGDNNHLYVTDFHNHRVQKFDSSSKFLLQFGTNESGNGQLHRPIGITVHNDKVYVAECYGGRCISVFKQDGHFSHLIGSSGHLNTPHYISVNAIDQLLVADYNDHCISIFTLHGNYVGKFDTQHTAKRRLNNPTGIATDKHGFVLVTDHTNNSVLIFDKDGVFIHSFGSHGDGDGQFSYPRGLVISPTGDIYICDTSNKRIQIFST